MSAGDIYDGFDAYLMTMANLPRVVPEGQSYAPQSGVPYVSSRMSAYVRRPAASGPNPVYIESGTFQINVHRPTHEGRSAGNGLADELVDYFGRSKGFTTDAGLVVLFTSASSQPLITSGPFLTVPVTVEWQTASF